MSRVTLIPADSTELTGVWVGIVGLGVAIVLVTASVRYPIQTLVAVTCLGAALLALRFPDVVLGIGIFACLGAGEFDLLSEAGQAILLAGGVVSCFRLISKRTGFSFSVLVVPLLLLGWLALRLAMGSGLEAAKPLAACVAALFLANACVVERRPWPRVFAWVALVLVFVSWRYGSVDATGVRFAGISSNPNRMVMAVLVAIPLFVQAALSRSSTIVTRVAMSSGIVVSVLLIMSSGSDQGVAGLFVIVVLLAVALTRRFSAVIVWAVLGFGLAVGAIALIGSSVVRSLSPDLTSLSGRTVLYQAGWYEFLQHPIIGSGLEHVSAGLTVAMDTHNSFLGIAAATGLLGGVAWLTFLIMALRGGLMQIRANFFAGAAAVGVVVSQLVQSVELMPLTWAVLLLAAWQMPQVGRHDD